MIKKPICSYSGNKEELRAGDSLSSWIAITAFNDQPASTSTITMTSDQTATIKAGVGIRFKLSGSYYHAICTAITSNLMTIAGAPLTTGDGDLTELYWTHIQPIQIPYIDSGAFADATDTALLEHDLNMTGGYKWFGGKAYLVLLGISTKGNDTGAGVTTQPAVNVKIAGSDVLSTALTIPDGVYTQSVVAITTANYDVNYGEAIELSVSAASGGTPANDAKDLTAILVFIPEMP